MCPSQKFQVEQPANRLIVMSRVAAIVILLNEEDEYIPSVVQSNVIGPVLSGALRG